MSAKDPRCHNSEYWDSALGGCWPCAIPCLSDLDCKAFCPQYYEKYHGSGSTIAPATTSVPLDSQASPWRLLPFFTGVTTVILFCIVLALGWIIYRRKRNTIRQQFIFTEPTTEADAEGNSGSAEFSHSSTRGATINLLSEAEQQPDNTYNLPADEKPLLRTRNGIDVARVFCGLDTEHRSNTSSDDGDDTSVTSHDNKTSANGRPSTSVTSHDNQVSVNVGLPNRVTAHDHHENANPGVPTSRTPYDSQGVTSSVPPVSVTPAPNGRHPTSVTSHDNQGSANARPRTSVRPHRNQGMDARDPLLSGDPGSLELDLRSDPPESWAASTMNTAGSHNRTSDTGRVSTPTLCLAVECIQHARRRGDMPWVRNVRKKDGKLLIITIPGDLLAEEMKQQAIDVTDLPDEALVLIHQHWRNPPAPGPGPQSASEDSLLDTAASVSLDLRSGIEYAPELQAAENMDQWVVVEQMSGTGGVSTGAVLRGCERIEEHAIHMPWVRGCFKTGHKLGIYTERGERSEEAMRQQALDVTGLPRQALVFSHQHWLNHPAPGPGPYPPQESNDSLFGDSGLP